ncbi:pentatricopeptide repeat-containing protein At3g12770 [Cryptomeria japonica]|uniref:pentatricopeptide repeat-containing protein At3g12770 n=1 Tax=Cryptomeria japonica TaxID=3369 RepID=UPI0027DA5D04|nr:pentatricopeptide repeat-containing protein At3g12770 [Cryptomeria japonica]
MVLSNAVSRKVPTRFLLLPCPFRSFASFTNNFSSVSQVVLEQNPESLNYAFQSKDNGIAFKNQISGDVIATYASLAEECTNITSLNQLNALIHVSGLGQNVSLGTKLVHMYARYSSMDNGRQVFDKMQKRDAFLWNSILRGYAWNGPYEEALSLYSQMQHAGIWADNYTYAFVLKASAGLSSLKVGRKIHCQIIRSGFESHVFVRTSLVDMYSKSSSIDDARQVFDEVPLRNVVSWNAMIAGYSRNGHAKEALALFYQMRWEHVVADSVTMVNVLPACAELRDLKQGKCMHDFVLRNGFDLDPFVGNSLIDMYAKCGSLEIACQLFDKMLWKDVVSWTAMIAGYAQNGCARKALQLFHQMLQENVTPDSIAIASVISACTHLGALEHGKWIHDYISKFFFKLDVFVTNSLIDMYARCGNLEVARQLFNKMPEKDLISWNIMLAGYGLHGLGKQTLELFAQMQDIGVEPNNITFVHILSACSHAGLVSEGWQYYDCMTQIYQIEPNMEHYSCMVDLLGRSGHLDEAERFIETMPVKPDADVWGALLGACRIHKCIELGERAAEHLFILEPTYPGYYVLLSNMYAEVGLWDKVTKVQRMMKEKSLKKTPACSIIVLHGKVHTFYAGDKSHPQFDQIIAAMETLA